MRIEVVTLFPEFVAQAVRVGVLGRAIEAGRVAVHATTPREFATDVHRTVDDRPYGGGPGMVLKVEPARTAIRAAKARLPAGSRSIYLAADGERLTHALARELAQIAGADAARRTLRRRRRAIDRVGDRRERVDRRLRVVGRRVAGAGADRRGRALAAGCARRRRVGRAGLVRERSARLAALHAARGFRGTRGAGSARERQSRRDPALAHQAGAGPDVAAAAGADREVDAECGGAASAG